MLKDYKRPYDKINELVRGKANYPGQERRFCAGTCSAFDFA